MLHVSLKIGGGGGSTIDPRPKALIGSGLQTSNAYGRRPFCSDTPPNVTDYDVMRSGCAL